MGLVRSLVTLLLSVSVLESAHAEQKVSYAYDALGRLNRPDFPGGSQL
jgi:YD repeat-containing protein